MLKGKKLLILPTLPCLRPPLGGTPSEFRDETYPRKTKTGYQSTRHTVISSQHGHLVTSKHCRGRGPKFSGHVDIKGHYQREKFWCPRPLRGKCFYLTHPPSKFYCEIFDFFFIFCSQQYGQQMEKNIGKLLVVL